LGTPTGFQHIISQSSGTTRLTSRFIFIFYLQNTEQIATANFYLNISEDDKISQEFLPRMITPKLD